MVFLHDSAPSLRVPTSCNYRTPLRRKKDRIFGNRKSSHRYWIGLRELRRGPFEVPPLPARDSSKGTRRGFRSRSATYAILKPSSACGMAQSAAQQDPCKWLTYSDLLPLIAKAVNGKCLSACRRRALVAKVCTSCWSKFP